MKKIIRYGTVFAMMLWLLEAQVMATADYLNDLLEQELSLSQQNLMQIQENIEEEKHHSDGTSRSLEVDNNEIASYDLEEAKQAREIIFKDETVTAIAKVIKSKEKELDIDADKVMEGFYLYTDKFFKILSKETKAKLDEVASFYSKKYRILNDKIAEIEAVLEMTETYEQMKEVLLQYGVLNWNEEK